MKLISLAFLFVMLSSALFAHAPELHELSKTETLWRYYGLGFTHILPLGIDHILFILALFFSNPNIKSILWQASIFTLAHTITLLLTMTGKISPDKNLIECIIALSIVFVAIENILLSKIVWWRSILIFLFGLIHGCGFASALQEIGMPEGRMMASLISFNLGIETGQAVIILVAWAMVIRWCYEKNWYRKRIMIPVSLCIGFIALYWTIERTLSI